MITTILFSAVLILQPPAPSNLMKNQSNDPSLQEVVTTLRKADQRAAGKNILLTGDRRKTGKLAESVATELGRKLYRVDLTKVFSKYIGETEKNLNKIFKDADSTGSILFFDEADALFAKRSEVKDSHDRYANLEIDYVLLRLEEYRGIAILATKSKANIDQPFLRRFFLVVKYLASPGPNFRPK